MNIPLTITHQVSFINFSFRFSLIETIAPVHASLR